MKLFKNWKFTYFEGRTILRDEFLKHRKNFIGKYGFSAFKRRVGRPHIILRCLFIVLFIACPKWVKNQDHCQIRSGLPYLWSHLHFESILQLILKLFRRHYPLKNFQILIYKNLKNFYLWKSALFAKEEMTATYLFKKLDFCKGIPLGKSNFLKR